LQIKLPYLTAYFHEINIIHFLHSKKSLPLADPNFVLFEQVKTVHALDCMATVIGTGEGIFKPDQLSILGCY
jgi:hypothetical protein